MDTRMKSSCSRSSNARGILGSRSSQLDDTNANRDANRHHWSCDIDPQEPQMMKLRWLSQRRRWVSKDFPCLPLKLSVNGIVARKLSACIYGSARQPFLCARKPIRTCARLYWGRCDRCFVNGARRNRLWTSWSRTLRFLASAGSLAHQTRSPQRTHCYGCRPVVRISWAHWEERLGLILLAEGPGFEPRLTESES